MFTTIWTPLAPTPLLWLTLTVAAFAAGQVVQRLCRQSPIANPVLIAIVLMVVVLRITGTPYSEYFAGAQFINFLLGPATVALAVPLALNVEHIRRSLHGLGLALLAGSVTATVSGVAVVWLLDGGRDVALSMAPKAVTTPIAMAVSQEVGGIPALTAALAIAGGIVAAVVGQTVLRWLRIDDWRSHGLAAGVAGSGIAAAQVAPLNGLAAAFAAIGIGLNGLITALVVPLIAFLWPAL
ncbi:Inner membrane protein YohK [Paraburkholderia ultramafica]|uniref:Inner membrane protein YohK n=1 Tax=Paraburkholderia ultramafica TaxID=1544867 RepID=A0A6S7C0K3_9BURK|nr:LrgB family protein [Paraburkholderia ultramafica]CAB3798638.1 Inner membrane protein YohK [Paraburkholderia ultramafica]